MTYFKNTNKDTWVLIGGKYYPPTIQVGKDTPSYLAQCLVNPELEQITEEEYKSLQPVETAVEYKPTYEELVQSKIATKYSLADEIAILRQIDTKPNEFKEYNDFCEQCKAEAKKEIKL